MTESNFRSLAAVLHGLTLACQIVFPIIVVVVLVALAVGVNFDLTPDGANPHGIPFWLGVAVGLLPAGALFWSMNLLRQLFWRFRSGDVLTEGSAALIRTIGLSMLALAVLNVVVQPIQTLLFTIQSPPGERQVAIGIQHADIGFLLLAGLLTLIGWAMTDAARQAEENKAFV